jgi:hypothetical protein
MSGFDFVALLKAALPDLAPSGGSWTFPLDPGGSEHVAIEILPHWVCFEFALLRRFDQPPSPMTGLLRQSAWPGNVKLFAKSARLALRAEVPLIVETAADRIWVTRQLSEAATGLRLAAAERPSETPADADSGWDTAPELLADRCRAAGWQAVVKTNGDIHVDIEPRSVRRVVSIVRQKAGLRARVSLGNGELALASTESLSALAHFLLRATSSLRFARAWVSGVPASLSEAGFECTISACAGDSPLVMTIDALTTACDLFGCEAEALIENAALARRYLQVAQGVRRSAEQPNMQIHAPTAAPVSPLAAGAAVPVYLTTNP